MTNELAPIDGRDVQQFDPERYKLKQAALDYGIEEAKQLQDWPALEHAVDLKLEEQRKFVAWWDATVRDAGGDRQSKKALARIAADGLSRHDAERLTGMKHQRVSDLKRKLADPEKYRVQLLGVAYQTAMLEAGNVRGTGGTGENEWFTPDTSLWPIITRVREVLGEIDLDPATHEQAQKTIRAAQYFTKEDDGLKHEWHGRVWLNPPYAQPLIAQFVTKMCAERNADRVIAAIMLTHNYSDTTWFHEAANTANAICFTRGRIRFHEPDGTPAAPTQGQAFFYFGPNVDLFTATFESIGLVMEARRVLRREQRSAPRTA